MRGRTAVWMVAAAALAFVSTARASQDGGMLDVAGLKKQASQNKALARYIKYNGMPEMAEVRPIMDQPPWDDHEVTLYYLNAHREISFARARVLGRPEVHTTRYQRVLTDGDVRSLKAHGTMLASAAGDAPMAAPTACTGNAAERAECAAARAEDAANRIDVAATKTEKAAVRAEAIAEKMSAPKPAARRHATKKSPAVATRPADAQPTETQPGSAS